MATALITGGSSGIGAVFAQKLAARGYDLILVARRADRLTELAQTLPVKCECVVADLATDEGVEQIRQILETRPDIDLLVNNAGFGSLRRFWNAELKTQTDMHRVHVLATVALSHAALKGMVARGRGGVINVASVAAFGTSPGNVSYCATKAWMNRFTEGLHVELKTMGSPVKVQALCPGFTITEFHDTLGIGRDGIPNWMLMTAEYVVDDSLRGFDKGKVIVVPGWFYKMGVTFMRFVPPSMMTRFRPKKDNRV